MLANLISRTRRNHGLEHATIHVLSERHKNFSAQGNSNHTGFFLNIYGDIPASAVRDAVHEAHRRLRAGERELAVHPNCGTVLLTTATLSTLAAQAAFTIEQHRQARDRMDLTTLVNALPSAVLAVVVTLILSRPIGMHLQAQYTTDGDIGAMEVADIREIRPGLTSRVFQVLLGQKSRAGAYRIITTG